MKILLIDSTGTELWVALAVRGGVIQRTCGEQRAHDRNLNRLVGEVLAEAGIKFGEIDAFAAVTGPGSWTGCRVGVAAVKAYSCAFPAAKVIELRSGNRTGLLKEAERKFAAKEFLTAAELVPFYDGEFNVSLKKVDK